MSWASSEWKDGLPARALQKIGEYESQLERMKKEFSQKEFQLDSLKQACDTKNIRYSEMYIVILITRIPAVFICSSASGR